jgi:hypothetical protein
MEGLVEVMSDIFISELEKAVDVLGTLDVAGKTDGVGATGAVAVGADGAVEVSEDWASDPRALKGDGLRVRRRRW